MITILGFPQEISRLKILSGSSMFSGEFKAYDIFFDELCLLMIVFDKGQRAPGI